MLVHKKYLFQKEVTHICIQVPGECANYKAVCHPFKIPKLLGIIPCTYTSCGSTAVRNPFSIVLIFTAFTSSFSGGTKSEQAANWRKQTNKTTSKTNWRIGSESLWVHSRFYKQEVGQAGPPSPRPEADASESTGAGRGGSSSS